MNRRKVLIVDDEYEICLLLSSFLKSKGYETIFANSVHEGVDVLEDYAPDIVFLDINLPDGLGFDLVPKIKSGSGAKIIVISAREGEEEKALSRKFKVDDYITKPFARQDVLNSIEKITQL